MIRSRRPLTALMPFNSRSEARINQRLRTLRSDDLVLSPYDMNCRSLEETRFKESISRRVLEFLHRGTEPSVGGY